MKAVLPVGKIAKMVAFIVLLRWHASLDLSRAG